MIATNNSKKSQLKRLWDYHTEILHEECRLHKSRILNLLDRWKRKSQEGLLPLPEHTRIFEELEKLNEENIRKLTFFMDSRLKRWERRSFEDILEMTDNLRDMHFALAVAERCYWQRLEGYEAAAVDAVRRGTFSEAGTIQQICNAADFLCLAYWDKVFGKGENSWQGIVTFGQFHEFRNWRSFIFAPDYVKIYNFKMWVYFAHEVMHRAVDALLSNDDFRQVCDDLIDIFSAIPKEMKYAGAEYMAIETICDVMATLVAGETYIQTLSSLKYYPSITVFSKRNFFQRCIRYPMLLRTIISGWAIRTAWGFDQNTSSKNGLYDEKFSIQELIRRVWNEDEIEHERALFFLKAKQSVLRKMLPERYPIKDVYRRLKNVHDHEEFLKYSVIPSVVKEVLRKAIIPRIKSFVQDDCYHTESNHCFFRFIKNQRWSRTQIMQVDPRCCQKTTNASDVLMKISEKRRHIKSITDTLLKNQILPDANPTDIITSLNLLSKDKTPRGQAHSYKNAAIMSICSQTGYRNRRFTRATGKN